MGRGPVSLAVPVRKDPSSGLRCSALGPLETRPCACVLPRRSAYTTTLQTGWSRPGFAVEERKLRQGR